MAHKLGAKLSNLANLCPIIDSARGARLMITTLDEQQVTWEASARLRRRRRGQKVARLRGRAGGARGWAGNGVNKSHLQTVKQQNCQLVPPRSPGSLRKFHQQRPSDAGGGISLAYSSPASSSLKAASCICSPLARAPPSKPVWLLIGRGFNSRRAANL